MDDPIGMRNIIDPLRPRLWPVSPRFFGEWFGGPLENLLRVIEVAADHNLLIVTFDENEILEVDGPRGLQLDLKRKNRDGPIVTIAAAHSVTWRWYSYGKPRTEENRYYIRYERSEGGLSISTNVTWYQPGKTATADAPAVALY